MSAANRDEKLCQILDEFGLEGYGAYWIILEIISEKMTKETTENNCFVELSEKNWRKFLPFSPKKFRKFVNFLQKIEVFLVKINKKNSDLITIENRNLLKYRDEYTRKPHKMSGQCQEQLPKKSHLDTETETDTETDIKTKGPNNLQKPNKPTKKIIKHKYLDNVYLAKEQYEKLVEDYGKEKTNFMIETLNNYKMSKGKKYKSDYHAIKSWVVDKIIKKDHNKNNEERKGPKYKPLKDYG
ncbi:MAG: hypothetical protein SVO01_07200 [Thermotogota bacterium]|nr:hypothetical protein [Thermotogota bacterium]